MSCCPRPVPGSPAAPSSPRKATTTVPSSTSRSRLVEPARPEACSYPASLHADLADDPAFVWHRLRSRRFRDIGQVEVWGARACRATRPDRRRSAPADAVRYLRCASGSSPRPRRQPAVPARGARASRRRGVEGRGTVAKYTAEGIRCVLVCCTGGEAGDILNPAADTPDVRDNLAEVRIDELRASVEAIGYSSLHLSGTTTPACPTPRRTRGPTTSPHAARRGGGRLVRSSVTSGRRSS